MSKQSFEPKIVFRPTSELNSRPDNPRTHSRKQLQTLMKSMDRFGFTNPVLIDDSNMIVAGHARVLAARELGIRQAPTICLAHLTKAELRAYVIADNRTAELSGWDRELLALNLELLGDEDPDFDLSISGFSFDEIELLRDVKTSNAATNPDVPVPCVTLEPISRRGDLWLIGEDHRLLCGDATAQASYKFLLGPDRADLIITDPPFNCPIQGHVSGLGAKAHREFVMASGELSPEAFRRFLSEAMQQMVAASRSGSVHYIFSDWRIIQQVLEVGAGHYDELLNVAVWNKTNGGMGSFYRSQHELIAIFRKGRRRHVNNVELGANGRYRTNVWTYAGANSFGAKRDEALALHPTVKPSAMIADAIMDASHRGDLVLDPFGGSGTTLLACEAAQRRARLIELDPLYVDVILRRSIGAGMTPRLASSGATFNQVSAERAGECS